MKIYIFGNGNIKFSDFEEFYLKPLMKIQIKEVVEFFICDFRGLDTLMMEYLKYQTKNVTILHIGEKPRYIPDKYKTKVSQWKILGKFESDELRDNFGINECTHFIAYDFNSNNKRLSGTKKNIEKCIEVNKIRIE